MSERLQKIIAEAGLMSRRAAEQAILDGRVVLNGRTATLGESASPGDEILVDGLSVAAGHEKIYLMLHKPRGVVTTMCDEKGRRCVSDLVKEIGVRVYPVGRLDLDSEGLLLMTNDGDFAYRLTHPSHEIDKTYLVRASGPDLKKAVERLALPMTIEDYTIRPAEVMMTRLLSASEAELHITIHEGRNRQIRKMCETVGLRVLRLVRIREGSLALGDLPSGKWRYLTEEEIRSFD